MAQRDQRGWLKKAKRASPGETWGLFFRTTRRSDGKTGGKQNPYKLGPTPSRRKQCMLRGRNSDLLPSTP